MALVGHYEEYISPRAGGQKRVKFILHCDNFLQGETFDAAIIAASGRQQPMVFRGLTLKARQSFSFDYDTVDWTWCDGDTFVILGRNDSIKKSWPLKLQTYAPGECPHCHGTKRCPACNGRGYNKVRGIIEHCHVCHATGLCQVCYVPSHNEDNISDDIKRRRYQNLRDGIRELTDKIESLEWELRIKDLKDWPGDHSGQRQLLSQYRLLLSQYQSELRQLEASMRR